MLHGAIVHRNNGYIIILFHLNFSRIWLPALFRHSVLGDNYPVRLIASLANVTTIPGIIDPFSDDFEPPFQQPALQRSAMNLHEFTRVCIIKFEQ